MEITQKYQVISLNHLSHISEQCYVLNLPLAILMFIDYAKSQISISILFILVRFSVIMTYS